MPDTNPTRLSWGSPKPVFYNLNAAAKLTGIGHPTIRKYAPPDAWLISVKGDKSYPVWLASTLEPWAAEFRATHGETAQERMRHGRAARKLQAAPGAHDARRRDGAA